MVRYTDIFEILQEVGYGLPLAIGEHRLVESIAGLAWSDMSARAGGPAGSHRILGKRKCTPPQHELQAPIAREKKAVVYNGAGG